MEKEVIRPTDAEELALVRSAVKAAMDLIDLNVIDGKAEGADSVEITSRVMRAAGEINRLTQKANADFRNKYKNKTDAEVGRYFVDVNGAVATAFWLSMVGGSPADVAADHTVAGGALLSFAAAAMAMRLMGNVGSLLSEGGEAFYVGSDEIRDLKAIGAMD